MISYAGANNYCKMKIMTNDKNRKKHIAQTNPWIKWKKIQIGIQGN